MPFIDAGKPLTTSAPQPLRPYHSRHAMGPTLLDQLEQRQADNQRMYHQNRRPAQRNSAPYGTRRSSSIPRSRLPDDQQRREQGQLHKDGPMQRYRRMGVAVSPMGAEQRHSTAALERADERWQARRTTHREIPAHCVDGLLIENHQLGSRWTNDAMGRHHSPRHDSVLPSPRPPRRSRPISTESSNHHRVSSQPRSPRHRAVPIHSITAEAASQRFTVDAPLRARRQICSSTDASAGAPAVQSPVLDEALNIPVTATASSSFQVLNRRPLMRPATPPVDSPTDVASSSPSLSPGLPSRWPFLDSPPQIDDADFFHKARLTGAPSPCLVSLSHRRRRCSCRTQESTTTASTWTKYARDPACRADEHDGVSHNSAHYCHCPMANHDMPSSYHGSDALHDGGDSTSSHAAVTAAVQVHTESGGRRISGHFRVGVLRRGMFGLVHVQADEQAIWDELERVAELCCGEADGGYMYAEGEEVFEGLGLMG